MELNKSRTMTIRLTDEEADLIQIYAKGRKISVSDAIRMAILEQIENEYDLDMLKKARTYNVAHPETYTHDEMKSRLGLS